MRRWVTDKLWIKPLIREKLGLDPKKILFCEHHMSHAAASFFCSPFDARGDHHRRRRGRVVDRHGRRRPRHADQHRAGGALPALARAALLRVHRVLRLRGQRGRVQADGHGAVRPAEVHRSRQEDDQDRRRRLVLARSRLLRVPLLAGQHAVAEVRRGDGRAAARSRAGRQVARPVLLRRRVVHPGRHRGDHDLAREGGAEADRAHQPVPVGRRRAELGRQRQDPARRGLRADLHPAGAGRRRRRDRRGAVGLPPPARQAARARRSTTPTSAASTARARSPTSCARTT